ncbi:hypothetical protein P7K49_012959 [Saguinus oedipus]|uniref:Uncharacterized protein n=1 Tax=Saguinus oedipus TaxID=9490 RepID=A0ABQ9VEK5_SAGOE|nr:hypothetical protein P7K49_012959 [Saguinus oedipus]
MLSHSAGCWRSLWGSTYSLIRISRRLPCTPLAGLAELFSAHAEPGHSHQRACGPPPPPPPIPAVQGQRLLRSSPPSPSSPWPCALFRETPHDMTARMGEDVEMACSLRGSGSRSYSLEIP